VQLRKDPYGRDGLREFLRDVIAMANAETEGLRHIVVGFGFDDDRRRQLQSVPQDDFSGSPDYATLVSEFIEPPMRISYEQVTVDGQRIGVFEIGDCRDKPYMMRVDHSETLRRGDAYTRVGDAAVKMGRRQLQELFERRFRDAIPAGRIEVGFPGDIIHKDLRIETVDLCGLPSIVASAKLRQLIDVRLNSRSSGSTSTMARLTHARLFGTDDPYEDRTPTALLVEKEQVPDKYLDEDQYFLFETHAQRLQLVVLNQGTEPIEDASLTLVMPRHGAFFVAPRLPRIPHNGSHVDRSEIEQTGYPAVSLKEQSIQVTCSLGNLSPGIPVNAFQSPVRVCVGSELRRRRLAVRYTLYGSNLQNTLAGKLRLLFEHRPPRYPDAKKGRIR
jgi:hypothetical protein